MQVRQGLILLTAIKNSIIREFIQFTEDVLFLIDLKTKVMATKKQLVLDILGK